MLAILNLLVGNLCWKREHFVCLPVVATGFLICSLILLCSPFYESRFSKQTIIATSSLHARWIYFNVHPVDMLYCHYCGVRFHKQTITAISYLHDKWPSFNAHQMKMLLFLLVESVYWKRIHCAHPLLLCSHCHQIKFNKQAITSTYPCDSFSFNTDLVSHGSDPSRYQGKQKCLQDFDCR
ncbi:hypothetical protein P8452_18012 [Trifolium repens]|nr:hypothetical protein P8452_18012 [Trifolium repens]